MARRCHTQPEMQQQPQQQATHYRQTRTKLTRWQMAAVGPRRFAGTENAEVMLP
jgi:hypothetical protein